MKKKILIAILAALISAVGVVGIVVFTHNGNCTVWNSDIEDTEGVTFMLSSDETYYSVTGYTGTATRVRIAESYNGLPVKAIADSAFSNNYEITEVIIPSSVTSIGYEAFYNCTSLTSVTIGNGVASIGDYAFGGCYKLVEVINKSSLNITKDSYYDKSFVAYYALNVKTEGTSDIVNVNGYLFYTYDGTNFLLGYIGDRTDLVLPDKYNGQNYEIYKYAFEDCESLTSVTIGNGVTSIGRDAFNGCSSLTSVTIGEDVTSIGDFAFYGCNKLVEVINKSSLNITKGSENNGRVAEYALNVKKEGTSEIVNAGDYLFYTYNSTNYLLGYTGNGTALVLPDKYNGQNYEINKYAFYDCSKLTSVTIGSGVTSIGWYAFSDCSSLTSVTIPDSVTSIESGAFEDCRSLTSVTIGNGLTSIGRYAFSGCYKLVEVINKSSLNITKGSENNGRVAEDALNVKTEGTSDIVNVNDYLFYTYNSTNYLLGYTGSGTALVLPDKYNGQNYEIYKYAFEDCESLTSVTIPDSVTSIGDYAFRYCSSLTSITIPDSVTSIGDWAFYDCSSLTSVTIPDSVTSIGYKAFYVCSALTSVTIPDSVTSIGESAFEYCTSLTSVTIGSGVTSIGESAFERCYSLTSVYYKGTETGWNNMSIYSYNSYLTYATRYYYSESNPFEGESAVEDVNYWHYDTDGKTPVAWTKD